VTTQTKIYYEYIRGHGVEVTFDNESNERIYDTFSSLYLFNVWARYEMPSAELVEITDSNYKQLAASGVL